MSTRTFPIPPRITAPLKEHKAVAPTPVELPPPTKAPLLMRLMPIVMVSVMVIFAIVLFRSGTRPSPYMMLMPLTMLMGFGMLFLYGGGSGGSPQELEQGRDDFFEALTANREIAHRRGRDLHDLQTACYPHPNLLAQRVGKTFEGRGQTQTSMWQITPALSGKPPKDGPQVIHPFMTARVGAGLVRAYPKLEAPDIPPAKRLEPVTAGARRRFLRTQRFVGNCPVGIELHERSSVGFQGNQSRVVGMGRSMICSLAYNHSPTDLSIGIVSPNLESDEWQWLKWLPHLQDRRRVDGSGTARLAWRSLAELAADLRRGHLTGEGSPKLVVFIDAPSEDVVAPVNWPVHLPGVTLVVLRRKRDGISALADRYQIDDDGILEMANGVRPAIADDMSVTKARIFAQKMSSFRPEGWDSDLGETKTVSATKRSYFDVLGISDLDTWDPRETWKANAEDSHFEIPVGFKMAEDGTITDELATLDFGEGSVFGSGPHGTIQGITGSGKSFLLTGIVLTLCCLFGPDKLNLILMDFKGGATFPGFEDLPHVTANITDLTNEEELVARAGEVIDGELQRRKEFLRAAGNVKDIVDYRKLRAKDPDKYPPLPELIIFIDEFREFMYNHKEYLKILTRVGSLGRSLGVHIIPCSQFIDATLLAELLEHLTFGISLRSNNAHASRTVVKTDAPLYLDASKDRGQAIMYKSVDPKRKPNAPEQEKFIGFNVEAPYISPGGRTRPRVDHRAAEGNTGLASFGLANTFTETREHAEEQAKLAAKQAAAAAAATEYPKMKDALIKKLASYRDAEHSAIPLWLPTLRAPMTYSEVDIKPSTTPRLEFRLGDLDDPFNHARRPYILTPEADQAHVKVLGQNSSGRSTAIETIVCSAAQAYSPDYVSFYMIEYGGIKLGEIAGMPNVGGYARKTDSDKISRYVGEFFRLLDIRQREFGIREVTDMQSYLQSREKDPVLADPYKHVFLVIDGFQGFVNEYPDVKDQFVLNLGDAGRYGLHLIITAESEMALPVKLQDSFGATIYLALADPTSALKTSSAQKTLLKTVPKNQPGRCIDMATSLAARILVPQDEVIEPVDYKEGNAVFDRQADYGPGIRAFVQRMRQQHEGRPWATPIETAPEEFDHSQLWKLYAEHLPALPPPAAGQAPRRKALDIHLPIGISVEDLRMVTVPDEVSPYFIAAGDKESGRTSLLRAALNGIVSQFTPDEAQVVLIENGYQLLDEKARLAQMNRSEEYPDGYLLAYADTTKQSLATAMAKIREIIEPRVPVLENMSTDALRNRSWYSGPEVYVLIDNLDAFMGSSAFAETPLDPLVALISEWHNLGLHIYVTVPAQGFSSYMMSNKLVKAMAATNPSYALFSGPVSEGQLWAGTGIKFAFRRKGQAMLVGGNYSTEIVQMANARPWGPAPTDSGQV